jgi:GDPmannose 4,6-dehydratase
MLWLMLQQEAAEVFVIATGVQHSVREFVNVAAAELGLTIDWQGEGLDEIGIEKKSGRTIVRVDPRYFRPTEVETLLGDPSKAKQELGWEPEITFEQLVQEMIVEDLKLAERDQIVSQKGYKAYNYFE